MQWHAISGLPFAGRGAAGSGAQWPGDEPAQGDLGGPSLAVLCEVLAAHTRPGADCLLALWEGYGWIRGSPAVAILGSSETVPSACSREILDGPRMQHPGRAYILFAGPLVAANRLGRQFPWGGSEVQSPNLFWPEDRSWCVATEIDFDSTLVAGTPELIDAVLAAPALEAWAVGPEDSLAFDGDTVNT